MADNAPPSDSVPLSAAQRIDDVCLRFEAAWRAGDPPRLEEYLNEFAEPERALLFRELLCADVECRQARGLPLSAENYRERFPEYADAIQAALDRAGPLPP